jgi:cysteinyl-tRNA synthetase
MKLYNTLSGKKEKIVQPKDGPLNMFVCGPTVYDDPHIGNARTFVMFDALVRALRSLGHQVAYLQNITDIDDRIIARAADEEVSWEVIARRYEKVYMSNVRSLNVTAVDTYARATDYIPDIVDQVGLLIKRKHAYKIDGDGYYFDLSTFPSYGKLSRRTTLQAEDGVSRIDDSDKKKNRGDFCLWKFSKPGELHHGDQAEPSWKTALGAGRPGWHIEDTAITNHFFGPQYDIHGGGLDLKFPHHEAEIAQAEAAYGKRPFVKIWVHAGLITVGGRKMSKSLNNFVTIGEMLEKFSSDTFRLLVLSHHYRSPMDYTDELMQSNEEAYSSILKFLAKCLHLISSGRGHSGMRHKADGASETIPLEEIAPEIETMSGQFTASLEDDFNTPGSLAALFTFMSSVNPRLFKLSKDAAKAAHDTVLKHLEILGLTVSFPKIPKHINDLMKTREAFRKRAQFMESDRLRKQLDSLGYSIEDTPGGPFLWPEVRQ